MKESTSLFSVNLIPANVSLTCLFILLPHLLTLSTHHSHHPYNSLCLSLLAPRPTSLNIFHHKLPSGLRTDSMDYTTGPFRLSTWVFFYGRPTLWNRAGHYIFYPVISIFLLSFYLFPRLSRQSEIGCLPYFHTWCGLSANLECMSEMMSEMCCMRLAGNTGRKKSAFWQHRTTLSGYIFATKAHLDNRKKKLLSSDMSSTCAHNMVTFGLLTAEIHPVV